VSYRLEIRPYALADIAEAVGWYDEKESGLGSEFVREVIEAIDALPNNPLMYRVRHTRKNVRWKLLVRFPYRIVFRITGSLITVIAVLHSARHDRHWRERF
jgi:plasmid stabilization system protein ParE